VPFAERTVYPVHLAPCERAQCYSVLSCFQLAALGVPASGAQTNVGFPSAYSLLSDSAVIPPVFLPVRTAALLESSPNRSRPTLPQPTLPYVSMEH
jgi:hypothetical protein